MTGFPFKLENRLGKGGFASVYRGKFHEGYAAFKFIRVNEEGYTYDWHAKGCREYTQQEMINKWYFSQIVLLSIIWKIEAQNKYNQLVDKPKGYLYVKMVSKLKLQGDKVD